MPRRTIYNSSGITLTNGEQAQLQADASGNLKVVAAASSANEYTEDAAAASNPVGPAIILVRRDTLTAAEVSADGDNVAAKATSKGEMCVKDADAVTALQIMDDWDESDRAKVNVIVGQAGIAAGAGAVGATVPRVTLASDDPLVAKLPSSLGAKTGANSLSVVPASDASYAQQATVITVTPTVDANALGAGDVAFDVATITGAARATGSAVTLDSITITDTADQKAQLHLVFFNAATSLGTVNAAPDIDDTELLTVVGHYEVAAASWVDLGANAVFSAGNLRKQMKTNADANLYVAAFTTGTPTYGAATALQFRFGFIQH